VQIRLKVKHRDTIDVIPGAVIGPISRPEAIVVGLTIDGELNAGRNPVHLTLVEPFVIEVSADVALSGRSFRHGVKFIRTRPELDVADVAWPHA
jgi:hypothetical protein